MKRRISLIGSKHLAASFRGAGGRDEESPPRWNLARDFYASPDCEEFNADVAKVNDRARAFRDGYEDMVEKLDGKGLGEAIAEYEALVAARRKPGTYLALLESEDSANTPKLAAAEKKLDQSYEDISFFESEILDIKEQDLLAKLQAPELSRYASWVAGVRAGKEHMTHPEVVDLSVEYDDANKWERMYRELMEETFLPGSGEPRTVESAKLRLLDRTIGRQEAEQLRAEMHEALSTRAPQVALIYDMIVRDNLVDMKAYGYKRPEQSELISNAVDEETISAMSAAARKYYARLSHRYYQWKAEQHGLEVLPMSMERLNVPGAPAETGKYKFKEARDIVLAAHMRLSPRIGRVVRRMLDEQHVDAQSRKGKETGGFCMSSPPGILPHILMEYTGVAEDVSTLGHEMGHALQYILGQRKQGLLLSEPSNPVSETASIFSEMLTLDEMMRREKDPAKKKALLMEQVDGVITTSLRQFAFHEFEIAAHNEAIRGPLDPEKLSRLWIEKRKDYMGPAMAVEQDPHEAHRWMMVHHFFDRPFYVHSYTLAQVMAGAIFSKYKKAEAEGPEAKAAFVEQYIDWLETGTTKGFHDTFWRFEFDTQNDAFWEKQGFAFLEERLDALIAFDAPATAPVPARAAPVKKAAGARR